MPPPSPGGVVAVVVADLPEPDVWAPLLGLSLAVRTVDGLLASGVVGRVVLLAQPEAAERAHDVCADRAVVVHTGPRREIAALLDGAGCVLLHDATRPLTPPALVADVVRAAVGHAVVVPVLPLSDTVKRVDGRDLVVGSPDRTGLRVVQTPQAFRSDLVEHVLAGPGPVEQAWARVGEPAVTVPGDPLAFPVRSSWDRELAELVVAG